MISRSGGCKWAQYLHQTQKHGPSYLANFKNYAPIPKMEAWRRYWREIMHCWLLARMTTPKEKAPIEVATPKKVCNNMASSSPRPSSVANGTFMTTKEQHVQAVIMQHYMGSLSKTCVFCDFKLLCVIETHKNDSLCKAKVHFKWGPKNEHYSVFGFKSQKMHVILLKQALWDDLLQMGFLWL